MQILHNPDEDIDTLLTIIDPHNNKQMTYSEVVQLLSSQMTTADNGRQMPLLEKFVQMSEGVEMQQEPGQEWVGGANIEEAGDTLQDLPGEGGSAEGSDEFGAEGSNMDAEQFKTNESQQLFLAQYNQYLAA